ncbi:MAG: ABC transporter permease [Vicinamibacteraceae bacterium]
MRQELRYALRQLTRQGGATLTAIATLAVAIGAAAATWTLVSATLLHPVPGAATAPWYAVHTERAGRAPAFHFVFPVLRLVEQSGAFERVEAAWGTHEHLRLSRRGASSDISAAFVTHGLLPGLGVPLQLGRTFTGGEDARGAAPVAILTDRGWRQAFGGDPAVVGETVGVGRAAVTIVGVLAAGFRGLNPADVPDLYIPLHTIGDVSSPLMNYFAEEGHVSSPTAGLRVFGRLADDADAAPAVARLTAAASRAQERGSLRVDRETRVGVTPLDVAVLAAATRAGLATFAQLLAATVGLLLLVGCAGVALLLFVRIEARRTEFATRLALGGSVTGLVRGLALEAAIVAGAGVVMALPVAWWLLRGASAFVLPGGVDVAALGADLDARALGAAAVAGLLAFLIITGVAALHASVRAAASDLLTPSAAARSWGRRGLRDSVLAVQVAVAVVLVTGALVFTASLRAALALNEPVAMETVAYAAFDLTPYGYDPVRAASAFAGLQSRLTAHPSVIAVASSVGAGGMGPAGRLAVDGLPRSFSRIVRVEAIDANYLDTMRLAVTAGRGFATSDDAGPLVALASVSLARQLGTVAGALGRRIELPWGRDPGATVPVATVVGIVPDLVTDVGELQPLTLYVPLARYQPQTYRTLTVRAAAGVEPVARAMAEAVREFEPAAVPPVVSTFREAIARQMSPQRLGSAVLGGLGAIALLLTALSVFVLGDAMATFRTRELGIRSALGATGADLVRLLFGETLRPVATGVALGIGVSIAGSRLVRAFAFQVEPLEPLRFACVAGTLLVLAVFASLRPALRAVRIDVARTLRDL